MVSIGAAAKIEKMMVIPPPAWMTQATTIGATTPPRRPIPVAHPVAVPRMDVGYNSEENGCANPQAIPLKTINRKPIVKTQEVVPDRLNSMAESPSNPRDRMINLRRLNRSAR